MNGALQAIAFLAVLLLGVLGGLNLRDLIDRWKGSAAQFEEKP